MAYERRGSQFYYYRSRKHNKKVIKTYYGRGEQSRRAANEDAQRRAARDQERIERQLIETMDAQIAKRHQLTKLLSQSYLVNAGLYQHHRGEWRRRKDYDN